MNHRTLLRTGVLALLMLALGTAPDTLAQPGPEDKVDSLRWAAMQWKKEGMAEIANWKDSLYVCITGQEDDGSGVRVDPGEGDGISVTTRGPDLGLFTPDEGLTFVWEGKDDPDGPPYDVAIVDLLDEPDPDDGKTPGIGVGIHFPELANPSIRIVVFNDNETPVDTVITDPGPDPPGPGPFPFPDPPTVVWIDTGFPPTELCDKHFLMRDEDGFTIVVGPEARGQMGPEVGYELTLAVAVPLKVRGSGTTVMGNRLLIIPQNPVKVPQFITTAHAIPRHLMEAVLVDASVRQFNLEHHGLGEALMTLDPGRLSVANIGSSGLDGVRTELPDNTGSLLVDIAPLVLQNGQSLKWTLFGVTLDSLFFAPRPRLSHIWNDSLWWVKAERQGNRTFFTVNAGKETAWTSFTMQFVKNGNVLKQFTIPDGFRFGVSGITLEAFGRATKADQGWEGFSIDILRNGQPAQLRFLPVGGEDLATIAVDGSCFEGRAGTTSFMIDIEGIAVDVLAPPPVRPQAAVAAAATPAEVPRLLGNYPEPFNPVTTIRYTLPEAGPVRLEVFDLTGRRVALLADGYRPAGAHATRFDATGLASGVYLYRLRAGGHLVSHTMLLMK